MSLRERADAAVLLRAGIGEEMFAAQCRALTESALKLPLMQAAESLVYFRTCGLYDPESFADAARALVQSPAYRGHTQGRVSVDARSASTGEPRSAKAYTSAVAMIPPRASWEYIDTFREKHDKAFKRWMPHINMLYPFIIEEKLGGVKEKVEDALARITPEPVVLDSISHFRHGKKSFTMFLQPCARSIEYLRRVQLALVDVFPEFNDLNERSDDKLFQPHLTLGQFKTQRHMDEKAEEFLKGYEPISMEGNSLSIITRGADTPFALFGSCVIGKEASRT